MIVITANLRNGGAASGAIAGLLDRHPADILAVQELSPQQAEVIATALPHGLLRPRRDHLGLGLASSRPIEVSVLPMPLGPALTGRLAAAFWPELPEAEVINVHLASPLSRPILRSLRIRTAQVKALLDHFHAGLDGPMLLMGDLNATPLWPAYRHLHRHLDDAALSLFRRPARTWGPLPRGPALLRIDHVLVRRLVVRSVEVVPLPGSDHRAVVASIRAA